MTRPVPSPLSARSLLWMGATLHQGHQHSSGFIIVICNNWVGGSVLVLMINLDFFSFLIPLHNYNDDASFPFLPQNKTVTDNLGLDHLNCLSALVCAHSTVMTPEEASGHGSVSRDHHKNIISIYQYKWCSVLLSSIMQ